MSLNNLKLFKNKNETNNIIITNKYFTFIQIPKTSSTSILHQCKKYNLIKSLNNFCYRHEGLLYLENFININKPVYAIVRNPFNHILSWFFHCINYKNHKIKNRGNLEDENISIFERFNIFVKNNINDVHLRQIDYLKSNKGIQVKFFKFENNNFIDYINNQYNLCFNKNYHKNRNYIKKKYDHKISEYFKNKEIVNLIIKERSKEFKMFNYSTEVSNL